MAGGESDGAGTGSVPPSELKPARPITQVRPPAPPADDARTAHIERTPPGRGSPSDQPTTETVITQPIAAQPPAPEPPTAEPSGQKATTEPSTGERATAQPAPAGAPPTRPRRRRRIGVAAHRRAPGLWFPITVFLVLLIAAAAVGRFVVPRPGPDPGAMPSGGPPPAPTEAEASPTLPPLPTPPVRPADALADWAGRVGAAIGVPPVAIQAYGYAQLLMQDSDPSCKLSWTTLAGIGEVESFHGQADGAVLGENGRSDPVIIGPPLDGQGGRARVTDTDAGAYDGDTSFDRAMGPLRLTPSMWRTHAADADADGIQDPYDIDDASLALARLLCSGSEDLSDLDGWTSALRRYRSGDAYAQSVFKAADGYGQRTRNIV